MKPCAEYGGRTRERARQPLEIATVRLVFEAFPRAVSSLAGSLVADRSAGCQNTVASAKCLITKNIC